MAANNPSSPGAPLQSAEPHSMIHTLMAGSVLTLAAPDHRPYEGQQHGLRDRGDGLGARHHRPYEGQQRVSRPGSSRRRRQVIIAPARGSNARSATSCCTCSARHHRPYEGQQPLIERIGHTQLPVIIAPTRGSNDNILQSALTGNASHHRPYEGQQRPRPVRGADRRRQVIIAPTRGSNKVGARVLPGIPSRHHRPARGSNHEVQSVGRRSYPVIIAPTRGSNVIVCGSRSCTPARSSSPLRGAATWISTSRSPRHRCHHRPYEGAATPRARRLVGASVLLAGGGTPLTCIYVKLRPRRAGHRRTAADLNVPSGAWCRAAARRTASHGARPSTYRRSP